uniref:Uncharacterized protein n=1 Tax=Leersia perrieri TaxID=77586 RepID=A0A0D9X3T3_9ORYZ
MEVEMKPTATEVAQCRRREVAAAVAVDACLVVAAMGGASLLALWAVAFHPSNSRLWMVPVGLVLAFTPVVVYLALSFSQSPACDEVAAGKPMLTLSTVVVDK